VVLLRERLDTFHSNQVFPGFLKLNEFSMTPANFVGVVAVYLPQTLDVLYSIGIQVSWQRKLLIDRLQENKIKIRPPH